MPAANAYVQLAEDTTRRITHSHTEWTGFLKTAARLYKYPYHEQLMIYAQRPEATACADYRVWNDRMRRYIRLGYKGIALLDVPGTNPNSAMCSTLRTRARGLTPARSLNGSLRNRTKKPPAARWRTDTTSPGVWKNRFMSLFSSWS